MKRKILSLFYNNPITKPLLRLLEGVKYIGLPNNVKKIKPILVYQMGKVASSSVAYSIQDQYNGYVFQNHSFSADHNKIGLQKLYKEYQKNKFNIKIISLVREPIGRNLSAFFQNFERDVGGEYKKNDKSPEELQAIFLRNYNHDIPLVWFDRNIEKNFNVNVYDYPFSNSGYIIIKKDNIELLIMKHNLDNAIKEEVLKDFTGIDGFKLNNYNVSADKKYNKTYNEVRNLALPDWYLDKMLGHKYTKHFYKDEIDKFRGKWQKNK